MATSYRLTVRDGPRVQRSQHPSLEAALDELQVHAVELQQRPPREAVDLHVRRFEPGAQVVGRVEISGPWRLFPRVRAGLDVRGDGSAEAWVGRARRQVVEPQDDETRLAALRRVLMQTP